MSKKSSKCHGTTEVLNHGTLKQNKNPFRMNKSELVQNQQHLLLNKIKRLMVFVFQGVAKTQKT